MRRLRWRFTVAAVLTVPVVVLSMGSHFHQVFDIPGRHGIELILATPVLFWAGWDYFVGAWVAARHRSANMNTLVPLGTLSAHVSSAVATLAPGWLTTSAQAHHGPPVYFEVAAVIITLILLGRLLKARARSRTGGAIRALIGLQSKLALVERGTAELEVPIHEVRVGDLLRVRPGKRFPWMGRSLRGPPRWMKAC